MWNYSISGNKRGEKQLNFDKGDIYKKASARNRLFNNNISLKKKNSRTRKTKTIKSLNISCP